MVDVTTGILEGIRKLIYSDDEGTLKNPDL